MGASSSSYARYSNDFELVIRATKDLEHLLETGFGAPSGKKEGLHDKISYVQANVGLSVSTVKKLRYLVTVRNKLVHERGFNKLPDRKSFIESYESAETELKSKLKKSGNSTACVIS
mmetsp:Transcript_2500/g.6542  ORF Transcript_2500/g.6542 Transcript_2500/m.6542 type:complete len:117 (-) Transcript_2500:1644-1994(-)